VLANISSSWDIGSVKRGEAENCLYDVEAMAGRPPTREQPTFGKKLMELRKARGLTQIELAAALGVSQKTANYYERRMDNPSLELISRLAEVLEVPPADLLDERAPAVAPRLVKSGPRSGLEEAFDLARRLPRQKQKHIAKMVTAYINAEMQSV